MLPEQTPCSCLQQRSTHGLQYPRALLQPLVLPMLGLPHRMPEEAWSSHMRRRVLRLWQMCNLTPWLLSARQKAARQPQPVEAKQRLQTLVVQVVAEQVL